MSKLLAIPALLALSIALTAPCSAQSCGPPPTPAPLPPLATYTSPTTGTAYAMAVSGVGDANGDGYADYAVGSPWLISGPGSANRGQLDLYSGKTETLLATWHGTLAMPHLGRSISAAGDVDQDGFDDLIVGASQAHEGSLQAPGGDYVRVYSWATGGYLFELTTSLSNTRFGYAVAGIGDIDADGFPDVAVGAPTEDNGPLQHAGAVRIYLGPNGTLAGVLRGGASGAHFGYSVSRAGDIDGDGVGDLLIGAPGEINAHPTSGTVYVISGQSLLPIQSIVSWSSGASDINELGSAVAELGDVDDDGVADFLVGARGSHILTTLGAEVRGSAHVISGSSFQLIHSVFGAVSTQALGTSVSAAGDVDLDGVPDFIAGAPSYSPSDCCVNTYAVVVSGATGCPLQTLNGGSGQRLGQSVSNAGDLKNGGQAYVIVGAPGDGGLPYASVYGPDHPYLGTGEDLYLRSSLGGAQLDGWPVKQASAGAPLLLQVVSPGGTFVGAPPILLAQVFPTGSPPTNLASFGLHIDLFQPYLTLYDGTQPVFPTPPPPVVPPFGSFLLQPGGLTLGYFVLPPLPSGQSIMLQAVVISSNANNGAGAAANAHELMF